MCTGVQVREARRLLGWTTERLAGLCNFPGAVIRTYEATERVIGPAKEPQCADQVAVDRVAIMRAALEQAGIVFSDGGGPGVRLRKAEG